MASDVVLRRKTAFERGSGGGRAEVGGGHLWRFSTASCSSPSSSVASWISSVASFPATTHDEPRPTRRSAAFLTETHEGVAGPGVARERQLPARPVGEAAAEGVLAVLDEARLELERSNGKREL